MGEGRSQGGGGEREEGGLQEGVADPTYPGILRVMANIWTGRPSITPSHEHFCLRSYFTIFLLASFNLTKSVAPSLILSEGLKSGSWAGGSGTPPVWALVARVFNSTANEQQNYDTRCY